MQGQTVSQPVVEGTSVCAGSNINISFDVTNGGLLWVTAAFTTSTIYDVYLVNELQDPDNQILLKSFQSNTVPLLFVPATITESISIPEGLVGRTDFRIFITSTNPTATSPNSSPFTIKEDGVWTGNTSTD